MPPTYVALDLETTGLEPERDTIIEIGAVKFRGEEVLGTFESLVNPGRPIPYNIQHLTGITPDDVKNAPVLFEVLPGLSRFVGRHPIVGHTVGFDLSFLRRHGIFQASQGIDTFELAGILLPHAARYSLGILAETLGIALSATHRALDDARATHALFMALLDQANRLDLSVIQAINRLAARSDWSLRPVFVELERARARTAFTGSLAQQLAAKGILTDGGHGLLWEAEAEERDRLRPAPTPRKLEIDRLAEMLEGEGLFNQHFQGFEYRPEQVEMLRLVAQALNQGDHLMVEAGTGTGKSIAYLLPAIHWAVQNGQRLVISTNTINLQDQLLTKDIPDLQRILPFEFKAVALKGRSNYVCPHRVRQMERRSDLSELELRVLAKALVWMPSTLTGDKQELFLPTAAENAVWGELCSDPELCPIERCRRENCFFYRARQAAESAHLIVVNHALLLADIAVENRVLPDYSYLIVDEAHHLEANVTNQLSFRTDQRSMERMLSDLSQTVGIRRYTGFFHTVGVRCRGTIPDAALSDVQDRIAAGHDAVGRSMRALYDFFNTLTAFLEDHGPRGGGQYGRRLRLTSAVRRQPAWDQVEISWDNLSAGLKQVGQALERLGALLESLDTYDVPDFDDLWNELVSHRVRLETLQDQMKTIIEHDPGTGHASSNTITWVEVAANTDVVSLHAAPLHVGELVRRHLFDAKKSVILTSATLRTEGNFDYLRERLGAWELDEKAVGSPFDYKSSTLLYLPTDIPEPNSPGYQATVESALVALIQAARGRTLVLFTSYSQLKNSANAIRERLAGEDIVVFEQGGGGSRAQLLDNFKTAERGVLLGTRSFWEGIDVTGEKLSCVVIARLPFAVPNDPIFSARSESYEDAFNQYSIPEAILRFRQGFGRLIRTRTDRGVVVCLDRRILSKRYGQAFIDSLPECTPMRASLSQLPTVAAQWIDEGNI
ncbi:MAG: DEAD/DEAH box helicase family protein [Anaerolineales bacterium]|nr:MAG: DEAD/DEAH box helicase family protein [Anaerolineales bacterium]